MIIEWLESAIGDTLEASGGAEVRVCCPFCYGRIGKDDTRHHMYVSLVKPVAFCFRCSWQGNYISLIMSVTGCSYGEALKQLEEPTPSVKKFDKLFSPMGLIMGHKMSKQPDGFRPLRSPTKDGTQTLEEQAVWKYLENVRHIPKYIIKHYMGWVPGSNRAWILVDNEWWQGRLIIPGDPKYLSCPWPKGDSLWNADALEKYDITICEGVFSALAVGSRAVALCGKTATEPQARRIAHSRARTITIMLDADAVASAYELARQLQDAGFNGKIIIRKLFHGDPTDGLDGEDVVYDGWASEVLRQLSPTEFQHLYENTWVPRL